MIQENIVDPNVEVKWYGAAAKKLLTTGTPGSDVAPFGVWSGECDGPFAITFHLKNNSSVDMTGLANIRGFVKTSGFHEVRPVIVLPDGTMLVADLAFSSIPMLTQSEFSLLGLRWLKLDKERVVTLGRNPAPANETWIPDRDRFSYEGVYSPERIRKPMVRQVSMGSRCERPHTFSLGSLSLASARRALK